MGDFLVSAHHKANTPRIQPMIPRNVSTDLAPVINATNAVANTGIEKIASHIISREILIKCLPSSAEVTS